MTRGELGVLNKVLTTNYSKLQKFLKPLQGLNNDFDPQTEADRSSQLCIVASLAKQYSNLKIIGEEGALDLSNVPPGIKYYFFESSARYYINI